MTTREVRDAIEASGFQFCRCDGGWALFDDDTRREVDGTRAKSLGDAIWLAADKLGVT